jgi:rod shape-determining protein MreC
MKNIISSFFQNYKEYIVAALLLIVSLSLVPLNEDPSLRKIKRLSFGSFAVINNLISEFQHIFINESEILRLKKLNAELMLRNNMLREYGLENAELKRLLSLKDTAEYPLIPARVISKLVSRVDGNFIINAGVRDSVSAGMPVINDHGLIGIVIESSDDFSVVRTLSNMNLRLTVKNQRSNTQGILSWNGKELIIKNVPTTADIEIGDRIVISEFSTILPPSIPVGIVVENQSKISGLLSDVIVSPFVDLNSVKNLFVIGIVQSKQVNELELNLLK